MNLQDFQDKLMTGRTNELSEEEIVFMMNALRTIRVTQAGTENIITKPLLSAVHKYIDRISKGKNFIPGLMLPYWCRNMLREIYPDGIPRGSLMGIWAESSKGKSSCALQYVQESCDVGYSVLFVTCEEGDTEFARRVVTYRLSKSHNAILDDGDDSDSIQSMLPDWMFTDPNRFRIMSGTTYWYEIEKQIIAAFATRPIDIVVIDYLQLITSGGDNKTIDLEKTARQCKELAVRFNVNVILVSQQQTDGGSKWAKSVYDICDTIWCLEIPGGDAILNSSAFQIKGKLAITKNRFNKRGVFDFYWCRERSRFYAYRLPEGDTTVEL